MYDPHILAAIMATFLVAGTVKGVIGLGLPTISLGLLAVAIDLPSAMALLLVPSFVTNVWQAIAGSEGKTILCRIWPFLLMATVTVWFGAAALTRVDLALLSTLLGALLVMYALINLAGFRPVVPSHREVWVGPLTGAVNGILTGMTGSFVVPGVLFLQAIGLSRDALIQAMGMLFTASTVALAFALQGNDFLTYQLGAVSAAALIPAIAGMLLGRWIRQRLSEQLFRRVFFAGLLLLGVYIIISASL